MLILEKNIQFRSPLLRNSLKESCLREWTNHRDLMLNHPGLFMELISPQVPEAIKHQVLAQILSLEFTPLIFHF